MSPAPYQENYVKPIFNKGENIKNFGRFWTQKKLNLKAKEGKKTDLDFDNIELFDYLLAYYKTILMNL